jgi:hypothetical protein
MTRYNFMPRRFYFTPVTTGTNLIAEIIKNKALIAKLMANI